LHGDADEHPHAEEQEQADRYADEHADASRCARD
jgi:hypothetical protein